MSVRRVALTPGSSLREALENLGRSVPGGFVRAMGVVSEVRITTLSPEGGEGPVRVLPGRARLIGADGPAEGPYGVLVARESESGCQVVGGELLDAVTERVVVRVEAVDPDPAAASTPGPGIVGDPSRPSPAASAAHALGSSPQLLRAVPPPAASGSASHPGGAILPPKPARPAAREDEPFPDEGDRVEHFAFGSGAVVKCDGDRLIVRLDRDGRVKELALAMLKVARVADADGRPCYRLDRRV